jgi:glycosyltransferase involved in cell wall biosynthesis
MAGALRVLHLVHALDAGGVEALIVNVYRHLDRSRIRFDVAVTTGRPAHFDAEFSALGGRIFHLPDAHSLVPYSTALARVLTDAGPFAGVHSHLHHFSAFPLAVADACGVPVRVAHSHNTSCGRPDSWFRACYRGLTRAILYGAATRRVGCSRAACDALFGMDPHPLVLRNAIDPGRFAPQHADRAAARRRLGIVGTTVAISHVGRFDEQKNHAFLLQVAAAVIRKNPGARLLLAGDGQLRPEVERASLSLGIRESVEFLGVRRDIPDILAASDVFVFPSAWEGLGIAVVEAQAAGVPAVVSDAVPREADIGCGLFRRLSLRQNAAAWAAAVQDAVHQPRPEWKIRQAALCAAGYDMATEVRKWEELYATAN